MELADVQAIGRQAADAFASVDVSALAPAEFREFVVEVQRLIDRVTVVHARALQYGQHTNRHAGTGARSMADWLAHTTGTAVGDTIGKVRLAEALGASAELAVAVDAGEVSPATARVLADAVAAPPAGADLGELVDMVKGADPRAARRSVELWRHWNHESEEERAERCHRARSLVFGHADGGMVSGTFNLPVLDARQVQSALQSIAGRPSDTDTRTTEQRLADALVQLTHAYSKGDVHGGRGGPTLLVTVPAATLACESNEPGVTTWGDLVPAPTVRQIAGHAIVRDVLVNGTEVLAVGRTRRLATTAQWLALIARDGGCRWPGCHLPAEWCDVDHFVPWEHGGSTNLDNLWLLCRHHHTEKHLPGARTEGSVTDATITTTSGMRVHCPPRPPSERTKPVTASKPTKPTAAA